jgi:Zn finger protein HypA/HybF involved in hydrogenase expression
MATQTPPQELEFTCKNCKEKVTLQRLDAYGKYLLCPSCKEIHEGSEIKFYHYLYNQE